MGNIPGHVSKTKQKQKKNHKAAVIVCGEEDGNTASSLQRDSSRLAESISRHLNRAANLFGLRSSNASAIISPSSGPNLKPCPLSPLA